MFFSVSVVLFYIVTGVLPLDFNNKTIECKVSATNIKNQLVNLTDYCADKPCITKCCGENEVLLFTKINKTKVCTKVSSLDLQNITHDYSDLKIYNSDIQTELLLSTKSFIKDFNLVQNKMLLNENCGQEWPKRFKGYILENGKFAGDLKHFRPERWLVKDAQSFCVELIVGKHNNSSGYVSWYSFNFFKPHKITTDQTTQLYFIGTGMLISSFFFLLVLLVYCVIPLLQNLSGMLFMAYVATMFLSFLMKGIVIFNPRIHFKTCKVVSPIMYFLIISSFLWLNIMSFDIWWTFRGVRLRFPHQRQKDVAKFLCYGLYAWGVAGTMATIAVLLDNADLSDWPNVIKPAFGTCFHEGPANMRYIYAPIGIITVMNILLFVMTTYNIWRSRKTLDYFESSSSNTKNKNRFRLYIKMSLLMGVSWAVEVSQAFYDDLPSWLFIIMNTYNTLLGVIIFFLFIFNKTVFVMLCQDKRCCCN